MSYEEEPIMVYERWQNEGDFQPDCPDKDGERTRVRRWHETFNAALTGLLTLKSIRAAVLDTSPTVRPMELAQAVADETHGPIPWMEKRIWASGSHEVRMKIHTKAIP